MKLSSVAAALASDVRINILRWLQDPQAEFVSQREGDLSEHGACLSLIAAKAGISVPTASRHIERLMQVGLVKTTRIRPWNFHAIDADGLDRALRLFDELRSDHR